MLCVIIFLPQSKLDYKLKYDPYGSYFKVSYLAGDEGFEPPITGPEPVALPLGQSPVLTPVDKSTNERSLL